MTNFATQYGKVVENQKACFPALRQKESVMKSGSSLPSDSNQFGQD